MAQSSPEGPNADRERFVALLRRLGATDAEAEAAAGQPGGGDFALELNLRTGPPLTLDEAAERTGLGSEDFLRVWHAFGLAAPQPGVASIPAELADAIPVISGAVELIGEDSTMGIARVVGSSSARIAEALVDAFRTGFEVPSLSAGTSYVDIVEQYVELTRATLPPFLDLLAAVVKAHLVKVSYAAWTPDIENQAARRQLFVGFVDLVGYTALARTLNPRELTTLLGRFEDLVADVVTAHNGRLVKLIGDGAMFTSSTAVDGCQVALALCERLAADDSLPPARVGADFGSVLSLYGDYYGEVVNRAARLVALAHPATVVVSDSVADALDRKTFGLERLPAQALKGFQAPAVTYRLLSR